MVNANKICLDGIVSPGPDYRLYLVQEFVDAVATFLAIKAESLQIGAVKTFEILHRIYHQSLILMNMMQW